MEKRGVLLVISGPSGAGKGTICSALLEKYPDLHYSISMTTRAPRNGEIDGKNYFFLDRGKFEDLIKRDQLLEYAEVYGNYYGTPRNYVLDLLNKGKDVLLEIDTAGAMQIKEKFRNGVFIFIAPPSLDELYKRIKKRDQDTEQVIQKRMAAASGEIAHAVQYNYIVVNNKVDDAVKIIGSIIMAEKASVARNLKMIDELRYGCAQR